MKTSRTFRRRNKSKKNRKTKKQRRVKRGGAGEDKTFDNKEEFISYLNKNNSWIDRIDIYTKEGFDNHERPVYKFIKSDFSKLYELENVKNNMKNYVFQFY